MLRSEIVAETPLEQLYLDRKAVMQSTIWSPEMKRRIYVDITNKINAILST